MKISKRLCLLFSTASLLLSIFAGTISVYADDIDYSDYYSTEEETTLSEEDAKTYANGQINYYTIKQNVDSYAQYIGAYANYTQEEKQFIKDNSTASGFFYNNFDDAIGDAELGTYSGYEINDVIDSDKNSQMITVDLVLNFTDGTNTNKVDMSLVLGVFTNIGTQVVDVNYKLVDSDDQNGVASENTETTDTEDESLSKKMADAAVNTVIGMGTVFIVLILISLIIYCFKFINIAQKRMEDKKAGNDKSEPDNGVILDKVGEDNSNLVDDLELVAVISAAIAASTGTSSDGFVVRSIRRR